MNRKKSNVTVVVPDLSGPAAQALAAFNKSQVEKGELPATTVDFQEIGYVQTANGIFALGTEGVGDSGAITPDNPLQVAGYAQWECADGTRFSVMPDVTLTLTDTELIMLPTVKEVQLEDFIRCFGRRLENNYAVWLQHFAENPPMNKEQG